MKLRSFGLSSLWSFLVGILIAFLVTACSNRIVHSPNPQLVKLPTDKCRMVQHAIGETCIPLNPQRIVIIDGDTLFHALALNIKPIAVFAPEAVLNVSYVKDRLNGVEAIPTTSNKPNLEKLLLLNPDLIMGYSEYINQENYELLSKISPTVSLPSTETLSGLPDWKKIFLNTATMFKKVEIANQLIDEYKHRAEKLKQTINNHQHSELRVAYLEAYVGLSYLSRSDSFAGEILSDVGFQLPPVPPHTESFQGLLPISEEALPEIDSDVLFIGAYGDDKSTLEKFQQKPLWSHVKAVQKNQVYVVSFIVWRGYNILAANAVLDDIEKYLVNTP
ncbi:periplasmic binding protein [Gloeocapsa sp. PCC 7428]|uniref:ABC transporter substrate-binding protein n=1 Tax=Gloeocapsa sp. PCC 7428 TaxID=1173026 RepID=UPI0002A5C593|nr:iron-siderophore ABC transporter substrate-binding protein [Gloeocapsa sp. PCC 7428]AFZ30914.1 periplasmic binding protein [Gloeocapsa sp. PCC 7428]